MNALPERKHLKRIPVWLPSDQRIVYFITACSAQRRKIFADKRAVARSLDSLERVSSKLGWQVHCACFMPDHVHMFLSPMNEREQDLSLFIQHWKSSVTQKLHALNIPGAIWQAEFFDRLLRSNERLTDKWNYVRMNPVRQGLCSDPEAFPFLGNIEEIRRKIDSL